MRDPQRYQRAKAIFFDACEQPRERRDAFVDEACNGDADLRAAVRQLLSHDDAPLSMINAGRMRDHLERLADSSASPADSGFDARRADDRSLPSRIGPYRILSRLGAGGMGVVYLAEQENPRRQVALKVIAPGQTSGQMLRRFEHEAQILGRLHHPGIAQVYEAGMHDSGEGAQPYFAMELVRGRPLLQHCEAANADRHARLELFITVCEAVQHAHQHGVIHRDLKPANILVEEADGPKPACPSAKILDFGVALLTDSDVQATTMHTAADQLIGTVAYMSPEQMSGKPEAIDARSDVYALGVILFELLAGRLPHDVAGKAIPEMIRVVSEHEPTSLSSVNRAYRGDLETIAGKAMEREPARRYQSAGELAADVRRHLLDEPIHARPPSAMYQMRKFARRNKALVGAAAAVFLALVGGLIGTTWQARQAIAARDEQAKLRKTADDNAALALSSAGKANAAVGFLQQLLSSADPHASKGRDYTVRQLLDDFADENMEALKSQPDVYATVLETVGMSYLSLGELKAAEPCLRQAMQIRRGQGPNTRDALANALVSWGLWQHGVGDFAGAEATMREAMALYESMSGHEADAARTLASIGDMLNHQGKTVKAIEALESALALQRAMGQHSRMPATLSYLASAYLEAGRYADAEPLLRQSIALDRQSDGSPSVSTTAAMSNLGLLLMHLGQYAESRELLEESLELGREKLGEEHPEVAKRWNNLGMLNDEQGDPREAESCFRRAIDIQRRHPEYDQSNLATMLQNLSVTLINTNRGIEAEAAMREAMAITSRSGVVNPVENAERQGVLGEALARNGEIGDAESIFRRCVTELIGLLGPTHPSVLLAKMRLADFLLDTERQAEAEPLLVEVFAERMKLGTPGEHNTVAAAISLARLRMAQGRFNDAVDVLGKVVQPAIATLGLVSPVTHHALEQNINALAALERWPEADDLVRLKIKGLRTVYGEDSLEVGDWLGVLGISLHEENHWTDAEPVLRESLDILLKRNGSKTALARVTWRLGAAQATLGDFEEAERLMLDGFAGIRDNPDISLNERLQAADWLANLYSRWGKGDEAAKWKALRSSLGAP